MLHLTREVSTTGLGEGLAIGRQPWEQELVSATILSRSFSQIYRCSALTSPLLGLSVPFLSLLPSPPHPLTFGSKFLPSRLCLVGALWSLIFFGLCALVSGWANLMCGSLLLPAKDGALILSVHPGQLALPGHILLHWTVFVLGI